MIVRNEEEVLAPCLESVKGADEIVILDTGSTDGTRKIAEKYTDQFYADEYTWKDDFADARNESLAKCHGEWVLSIDADETLEEGGMAKIMDLIDDVGDDISVVGVRLVSKSNGTTHVSPRLFRRDCGITWMGAVHNYLNKLADIESDIVITYGYSPAHKKDPDRAFRILKRVVGDVPDAVREKFYLAREYVYRHDWVTALYWYDEYLKVATWPPERVEAYYQKARCLWYLRRGEEARDACIQAIKHNADYRKPLELMAEMSGPINRTKWAMLAEVAEDRNTLFSSGAK
jgi:glycosyltransferase involved in cell wall biosynthesis